MFKQTLRQDTKAANTGTLGLGEIPASPSHQARLQSEQASAWSACCGPHTLTGSCPERGGPVRAVTHLLNKGWAWSQGLLVKAHIWEEVGQSRTLQGIRRGSFRLELKAKQALPPHRRSRWDAPGPPGAGSLAAAVMRLPVAAEQGAPGCRAAAGEAGGAAGMWGKGVVGAFEFVLPLAGRKVGFDQRTPSEKQSLISLASEFLVVGPLRLGDGLHHGILCCALRRLFISASSKHISNLPSPQSVSPSTTISFVLKNKTKQKNPSQFSSFLSDL